MRSDFYSLPWAAQQAIRRGESEAAASRRRAWTIRELQEENEKLRARVAELENAATANLPKRIQGGPGNEPE